MLAFESAELTSIESMMPNTFLRCRCSLFELFDFKLSRFGFVAYYYLNLCTGSRSGTVIINGLNT